MLKVSHTTLDEGRVTCLRIDGQVSGPWVDELRRVCLDAIGSNGHQPRVVLDFAGVSFLDAAGIAVCRELAARGVRITNRSPFVAEQLKGVDDAG